MSQVGRAHRIEEYWDWLTAALFLLLTLDTLTTYLAARRVGTDAELNPVMTWALGQGVWAVLAINLAALVVTVLLFALLLGRLRVTPAPLDRYLALLIEVWLGILLTAGLFVFANNLGVILLGQSLL